MGQYFCKNDFSEVRYFEDDIDVSVWIDLSEYRPMTDEEIDRHKNPIKYMTDEERELFERELMPILSKTQVELCLFDLNEYDNFEVSLSTNPRLRIQYNSTVDFYRLSPLTDSMQELLKKTDHEMDEFWLLASKIDC